MSKEILCVKKQDRQNIYEHILSVGGNGWSKTQLAVITDIENNWENYYVRRNGNTVRVIVAVSVYGHKYIKTEADGIRPDNLLSLPECP